MSETNNNETEKANAEDSVWLKSIRLCINVLANSLMFLTVFVCILFACNSVITSYHLHIILSVLGYQFCMCQGNLIMSKYNSWSIFIKRRYRKNIHWVLQVIAAIFVTAGASLIIYEKTTHFNSVHGKLGLAALVCCLASLLNGILAMYAQKFRSYINPFRIKSFHYVTGIGSLFLATGSLCAAFQYNSFTSWIGRDDIVVLLIFFTWLFTVLVSLDFWIAIVERARNML